MPLEIVRNDITKMEVDAIVCCTKSTLLPGGGVGGSIHRAAGPELQEACRALGGCETGNAKITKGYRLPSKYVIHTVGPVWQGGNHGEREKLVSCYQTSLALAVAHGCESVAFPLISAGAFGYPKDQALRVAVDTIGEFLMENDMTVYIVVFGQETYRISGKLFSSIAEYIDDNYVERYGDLRRERYRRYHETEDAKDFCVACAPLAANALEDFLSELDAGFSETLQRLIVKSGKKNSEIYKKANISKQHFSKIINDPKANPSKQTCIALALALELDLDSTKDLIGRAGYALSNSSRFDLIIRYFIERRQYSVIDINIALYDFDQPLLGG